MKLDNDLTGKVALVTGGGSGIGRAIALDLARAGANVALASRNLENLEKTASEIEALGRSALAVSVDVSVKGETDRMVERIMSELGSVDILVNGAGGSARERSSKFSESTEDVWDDVIKLNYYGVLNVTRSVIGQMIERNSGRIVNIASLDGVIGAAGRADYSGAKAAVIGFSKALAKEVATFNITVNCISPGPIESGYDEIMLASASREALEWAAKLGSVTGFGYGKKQDVSAMALFLASDESSFISGQNFCVCGLANINMGW